VTRMNIGQIRDKIRDGEPLSFDDGVALYRHPNLLEIGGLANEVRERLHGDRTYFNRNLHINATNVCVASCMFCSFARLKPGDPGAYTMSHQEAWDKLGARIAAGDPLTEVHIVNGLHDGLPFEYYEELLRGLKRIKPSIHLKAFTAVEIFFFHRHFGLPVRRCWNGCGPPGWTRCRAGAPRSSRPGCARRSATTSAPATNGCRCTAPPTNSVCGPTAPCSTGTSRPTRIAWIICCGCAPCRTRPGAFRPSSRWRFIPTTTPSCGCPGPTGTDDLRTYAVSRLLLHNIPHLKAYWIMLGIKTAQTALWFGADDLDGTVQEEKIYHMAGAETPQAMTSAEIVRLIRSAGRVPVERDTLYNVIAEGEALGGDKPFRRDVRKSLEVVS
jgi:aminodeoxyfutalosine synthase